MIVYFYDAHEFSFSFRGCRSIFQDCLREDLGRAPHHADLAHVDLVHRDLVHRDFESAVLHTVFCLLETLAMLQLESSSKGPHQKVRATPFAPPQISR